MLFSDAESTCIQLRMWSGSFWFQWSQQFNGFFFSSGCPEPPKNKQKTGRMKNKYWEWRRRGRMLWVTGEDVDETPEKTESEKRTIGKKDEGLWFLLEEFRRLGSLAEKFIYEKKLNFLFWHGVWMCDVYTHMDLCPALCVAYWSIHKYISASWLFYYVPSPDPWTISSTDSFTSFWIPSTFFLSFSYYLCVRYIIFAMARLVAAAVSICATPFLFRLPHSSPSLFFHFVIFLLIQKGSETDNFLLCYDDHTKEQKKKKRWKRGGPTPVDGWRLLNIWYRLGAGVFFMSTKHFCKSFPSSGAHSSSSGRGAEGPQVFVASHPPYRSAEKHDGIPLRNYDFFPFPLVNGPTTRSDTPSLSWHSHAFTRHQSVNRWDIHEFNIVASFLQIPWQQVFSQLSPFFSVYEFWIL